MIFALTIFQRILYNDSQGCHVSSFISLFLLSIWLSEEIYCPLADLDELLNTFLIYNETRPETSLVTELEVDCTGLYGTICRRDLT